MIRKSFKKKYETKNIFVKTRDNSTTRLILISILLTPSLISIIWVIGVPFILITPYPSSKWVLIILIKPKAQNKIKKMVNKFREANSKIIPLIRNPFFLLLGKQELYLNCLNPISYNSLILKENFINLFFLKTSIKK